MKYLKSINPYTLRGISSIEELSNDEIEQILNRAQLAFLAHKKSSFQFRRESMKNAANVLSAGATDFAKLITSEMGKLYTEAEAEVKKCAWVCEYYAEKAEEFLQDSVRLSDASESFVSYEPLGPILAVMPWNFPFWQVFRFAAPALMAGNTALLKHASNVQGCAQAIEQIFFEAGFEKGIFQHLAISSSKVEQLIASDKVAAVTLTGSEGAGSAVAALAGKQLKKCVLELGGNNAFVVLNDADIDLAVETAITARLLNSGQSCIAAKRFILEEGIYDEFIDILLTKLKKLRYGDPMDSDTDLAPLFSVSQSEEIARQIATSIQAGAICIHGNSRDAAFHDPTVLTMVNPGMPVFDEETFGPVFAISKVKNYEEALKLSNKSKFGLGMQVFTRSEKSADYFIKYAEEGAVFINGLVKSDPRLPFGGVKKSGFGRELSREGILEFVNMKTVWKR